LSGAPIAGGVTALPPATSQSGQSGHHDPGFGAVCASHASALLVMQSQAVGPL